MKFTRSFFLFSSFLCLCFFACENVSQAVDGASVDMSLYSSSDIAGSSWSRVSRNHATGELFEEGYVDNGVKVGTWTTYFPENGYIQNVTSYNKGVFTGPYIEFDERGRLLKQANYANNQLDGLYGEFKSGRPIKKIMYENGVVNGYIREYNTKSQLIKETNYKNNVLHGTMRNFNEKGQTILEYEYKDGEKISGGIVEQE